MNKDQALKYLPLIVALSEGKTIQFYSPTTHKAWMDVASPSFSSRDEYRIKPEPKVWFAVMAQAKTYGKYDSLEEAKAARAGCGKSSHYMEYGIFRCEEILE